MRAFERACHQRRAGYIPVLRVKGEGQQCALADRKSPPLPVESAGRSLPNAVISWNEQGSIWRGAKAHRMQLPGAKVPECGGGCGEEKAGKAVCRMCQTIDNHI